MDTSDAVAKIRKEMEGMVASQRPMSIEEHEAIRNLLLGIQTDAGITDSIWFENYAKQKVTGKHYTVC